MTHQEIVSILLSSGANVNTRNKDGYTALILAGLRRRTKIVIDYNAEINIIIYSDGHTCLTKACMYGLIEIVSIIGSRS